MGHYLGLLIGMVAFLYAMVGHGGASGYLAVGSLAAMDPVTLKGQALALNLLVAAFSSYGFTRAGFLRPKLLVPLALFSMPAAYAGARLPLHPGTAKLLLGFCLAAASFRMLFHGWLAGKSGGREPRIPSFRVLAGVGLGLGFLSGLTGVGGGIYLSPLLLLAGWADVKETAAVSAWFIWLNSAAGLLGIAGGDSGFPPLPWEWFLPAVLGGFLGAQVGAQRLGEWRLRQALAGVLLLAACKLILLGTRGLG